MFLGRFGSAAGSKGWKEFVGAGLSDWSLFYLFFLGVKDPDDGDGVSVAGRRRQRPSNPREPATLFTTSNIL